MIFYAPLSHFHDIFTGFVQRSLYRSEIKKYILVIEEGANSKQAVFPCPDWTGDDEMRFWIQ